MAGADAMDEEEAEEEDTEEVQYRRFLLPLL